MRAEEVIATHGNTDFDAFAAMLAARLLYPGAVVAVGSLNRNVRDFYRLHADELGAITETGGLELDAIRRLVVIEATTASRLGELESVALDPSVEKALFDHHGETRFPEWVHEEAAVASTDGALTTTLVGILAEREILPTALEATTFALGIHEDTGSLTYPSSTQRDADALAWCLRHGARQDLIATYLHTPLAAAERDLLHRLMDVLEPVDAGGEEVLLAAVHWPEYVEGISNLAHKIVDLTDARALVVLVEMDSRVFAVARSRSGRIDASVLAAALGGGGHAQAASAIARLGLDEARAVVLDALEQAQREPRRARDVMSTPPRSVAPDDTVRHAMTLCQRHGQSGVFVVDESRVVGGVSREDLDKAVGHDLSHAPVRGIMSSRVAVASEDAPLAELQALVTSAEDGRVAVLRDDELVGVISRSDLLRALEGVKPAPAVEGMSLARELHGLEQLHPIVEAVATLGDRAEGVYVVGGTLRDILLEEKNFDIDIAVEGDAIAFARSLASALGGRFTPHDKFGTAIVSYGDGERLDVVTTRTEFYDSPGALPTVERAALREDLRRRDFTINAMAASLKPADFGLLVDPYGGRADLAARVLRVLHNLSFIDDPTRIFRGIRYEARYGFRFDEHTTRLARGCIEMGLVGDLSSVRLRDELVQLLEDPGAPGGIRRLGELGLDRAIHSHLRGDSEAASLFERARALRDELEIDIPVWRLGVAVLARHMSSGEAFDWLDRLKVRRRDVDRIVGAVTIAPRIVERLREEELDPAQIVALADPFAPDAPLLALAAGAHGALRDYFVRLRSVELEIGGADLVSMGLPESPRIGEVLAEVRRRKLNGELEGRESELAAARELVAAADAS
ncbi:MAG: CBS domain-containing protein [Thermoleophilia bacterium]|nr:CBS domain-containing protein [Thermoleophilia bacterium]MDH4340477.1 CBS domain-containing protein [Thermoleophilia bacterium]